jgi:hypothetical protein
LKIAESSAGVNIAPLKRFVRKQALHDTSIDRAFCPAHAAIPSPA